MSVQESDFSVSNQGTIIGVTPLSQDAVDWMNDNVDQGPHRLGIPTWGDHRPMGYLIEGMLAEGFTEAA